LIAAIIASVVNVIEHVKSGRDEIIALEEFPVYDTERGKGPRA
jgi:hypothetical protein